jgi:uncharacterized protein (DUF433 family)
MNEIRNSETVLAGQGGESLIRKTPGVCGGDACIRETRIMVWLLVDLKQQGASDQEILEGYSTLSQKDLQAAWEYYRQHPDEIDNAIASQEVED